MTLDTTSCALPVARTIRDLREQLHLWRIQGEKVALIPTMGALHEGHLSLVDTGAGLVDRTVISIFVNPAQFAPGEDFESYPRTEAGDIAKLARRGDLVFAPQGREMYPAHFSTTVSVNHLTRDMEGATRPAHFAGVTTIVAKLLLSALPDIAVFGEKDYQQLIVIRRMVRDLNIPVEIVGAPVIREEDGLALSSRNIYLDKKQRRIAGTLNQVLKQTAEKIAQGAPLSPGMEEGRQALITRGFDSVDYFCIRHAETLQAFEGERPDAPARVLAAARLGKTRLLDNMPVAMPG